MARYRESPGERRYFSLLPKTLFILPIGPHIHNQQRWNPFLQIHSHLTIFLKANLYQQLKTKDFNQREY